MITLLETGAFLLNGSQIIPDDKDAAAALTAAVGVAPTRQQAECGTMAYRILQSHNRSASPDQLELVFDSMASHDLTCVGIVQTARASGMTTFPLPYVLTNCHNSLCAVGGTINEDDHRFALSAAKKYGGIYVPPNVAVIHTYMREMMSGCGRMVLASDSHTRYGALGTMGIGEGGGELAKQLVGRTYDIKRPEVIAVRLTDALRPGVGPHDVALSLVAAVFKNGYVKNKVLEFVGEGVGTLPVEYRNAIDVMTTETACLSSIWITDEQVRDYFAAHTRADDYARLTPEPVAYYHGVVDIDLSTIRPVIAMPFHPSNVYTIAEFKQNMADILDKTERDCLAVIGRPNLRMGLRDKVRGGEFYVDQGVIAGCSGGTFDNLCEAADILDGRPIGPDGFGLSIYPGSQPVLFELMKNGSIAKLLRSGATLRTAFCGPCFGAGDTPANGGFSIRHTTRNFPNREGSKPGDGQLAAVALMDARSIAATALRGGRLTGADEVEYSRGSYGYAFDPALYQSQIYNGLGRAEPEAPLQMGPGIRDWPEFHPLTENLLLRVASVIEDAVTTTDELIPSGETSSLRSDPIRLSEFTLSRRDPGYVARAKETRAFEERRFAGEANGELEPVFAQIEKQGFGRPAPTEVGVGSVVYANKPGDGSAREQAASCQRVLGGWANLAREYATKRYRSNCINWGMLPLLAAKELTFELGDYLYLPGVRSALLEGKSELTGYLVGKGMISLSLGELSAQERQILASGCLINYYRAESCR